MRTVIAFCLALSPVLASLSFAVTATADDPQAAPALIPYTVNTGDTCSSVSLKALGDASLFETLHKYNPQLGPAPHHLVEGQVLMVPAPSPDARLELIRNRVEVQSKPAAPHSPLFRGNRVSTGDASAAEMSFRDETLLSMGERSLVIILGATHTKVSQSADATLVNGNLRAHLADLAGHSAAPMTVATKSGEVKVGPGDVQVAVDDKQATRLAVYRGHSSLTAMKATTKIDEGFGSKAEEGRAPTPPRPLPPAPTWRRTPPGLILAENVPVDATAEYARGAGQGPDAAEWHIVLARDADFKEPIVDSKVPATTTRLELKQLAEGGYFARVSAIDSDHFEGPWGAAAPIVVKRIKTVDAPNHYGSVDVPPEMRCTIDGAPPVADVSATSVLRYDRLAPHVLQCALASAPQTIGKLDLASENVTPLSLKATWLKVDPVLRRGEVVLELADSKGQPISRTDAVVALASTPMTTSAGITLGRVQAAVDGGRYGIAAQWEPTVKSIRYTLSLPGSSVPSRDVAIDVPPPPPPPPIVGTLEVGIGAGAAVAGGSDALIGFRGDGHLGVRLPAGPGDVLLSAKATVERYGRQSIAASDIGLSTNPTSASTTNAGGGIPIGYRLGKPAARFAPFVTATPQFIFQTSTFATPGTSNVRGNATYFALSPALGIELRAGGGAFVLEADYRWAWSLTSHYGAVDPKGALGTLGYVIDL